MSVIVKGMEMPDTCEECRISIEVGSDMHCPLFAGDISRDFGRKADCGFECRPDWCPLRPLPEKHGRLIDADALMARSSWYNLCWHNRSIHGVQDYEIASMETIVEAEG